MSRRVMIEMELPDDMVQFSLPAGVHSRLQELLDRQDKGQPLTLAERAEAEGLINLTETLTLLRFRTERACAEAGDN